jgi:hypothetical protein
MHHTATGTPSNSTTSLEGTPYCVTYLPCSLLRRGPAPRQACMWRAPHSTHADDQGPNSYRIPRCCASRCIARGDQPLLHHSSRGSCSAHISTLTGSAAAAASWHPCSSSRTAAQPCACPCAHSAAHTHTLHPGMCRAGPHCVAALYKALIHETQFLSTLSCERSSRCLVNRSSHAGACGPFRTSCS